MHRQAPTKKMNKSKRTSSSPKKATKRNITTKAIKSTKVQRIAQQSHSLAPSFTPQQPQQQQRQFTSTPLNKITKASFVSSTSTHFNAITLFQSNTFQQTSPMAMMAPFNVTKRTAMTFKKVGAATPKAITAEDIQKDKEAKVNQQAAKAKKIPSLNDIMRQLYKKIHPDLMMDYPEQKEQNEKSLGTFQNFLGQLKNIDGNEKYPVIKNASLPFYLRTTTPGHFQRVELFLHTDATFNKKGIEKQLCNFFKSINLGSQFRWDDEYFPFKGKPDFKKAEGEGAEGEGAEGGEGSSSSGPTGSETYDQFMERIKKEGSQSAQNTTSM